MTDISEIHCPEGLTKHDVSDEKSRTYYYPEGHPLFPWGAEHRISGPKVLFLKRGTDGGPDSHRIVTADGKVHNPAKGWIDFDWEPSDPRNPVKF